MGVSKEEAYIFFMHYSTLKANKISINEIVESLQHDFGDRFIRYFTALSMELLTKEIIEGIQVDKK
jgi:hypothetical protein